MTSVPDPPPDEAAGAPRPARRRARKAAPASPALPPAGVDDAWSILARAGADVLAHWQETDHSSITTADLQLTLGALNDAARAAAAGAPRAPEGIPSFVPARRVLERWRHAFLRRCGTAAPVDVVTVVRAIEAVQEALDHDAAHRFAMRLTGHDAQQLVVEMAHDMRSPLGSILILAERLRNGVGGEVPPIQQRQLGLIYSAAFGLSALAGDVIELARGGTTLLDTQPIPFAVSDVLQSMVDILRPMAEEKRLTMQCTGPVADQRIGHPAALNRVLLNLATNAIKFTNAGSVEVTVRELDRVQVEFAVADTGRGIPPRVMAHLFEAFRQRQMPGDYAFSSAGLGLSICQKLVRAMGGELKVETELEQGTRFSFTLDLPQPQRL
ncbi:MAG: HAMP domain-containing histidine kinase [Gemmatimonadaceae bacterium]|nr:HAMP domain-containing histidine kinase [Gemmatimonadaceae bacterium]